MSMRTLLEINHDCLPKDGDELLVWAESMYNVLVSNNTHYLPDGVTHYGMRHHTDKLPAELVPTEV